MFLKQVSPFRLGHVSTLVSHQLIRHGLFLFHAHLWRWPKAGAEIYTRSPALPAEAPSWSPSWRSCRGAVSCCDPFGLRAKLFLAAQLLIPHIFFPRNPFTMPSNQGLQGHAHRSFKNQAGATTSRPGHGGTRHGIQHDPLWPAGHSYRNMTGPNGK